MVGFEPPSSQGKKRFETSDTYLPWRTISAADSRGGEDSLTQDMRPRVVGGLDTATWVILKEEQDRRLNKG